MILYARITDINTNKCEVGLGTNDAFYKSIGMVKMDVEQAWDGNWYKEGYAPSKPSSVEKEEDIVELKAKLKNIDEKASRSMRAILAGTATDEDRQFLAELEEQAVDLRRQIKELEESL